MECDNSLENMRLSSVEKTFLGERKLAVLCKVVAANVADVAEVTTRTIRLAPFGSSLDVETI